jgi:hypothetical protein
LSITFTVVFELTLFGFGSEEFPCCGINTSVSKFSSLPCYCKKKIEKCTFFFQVTSYSPGLHGHDAVWQWQISTGATWSNLPSPSGMMEGGMVVPTLKAFSLRARDNQQMILAAGDQEASVISPGGSIQTSVDLPAPPTHALICEDFSNDGLTDLIVVTSNGVYGFVQTRSPGALFFSTLVGCLLIVMGVIFVTQHLNSIKEKPRASSAAR